MALSSRAVITLTAPAKLTLSLRITGVRPDGFHTLDAEMVTISLADELTLDPAGRGLEVIPTGSGLTVESGSHNSIVRALRLVDRTVGVRLVKHIPAGAGLGGGSADAAAILRWAGVTDPGMAATLGADVPFCVIGGRARVTGIGEQLVPQAHIDEVYTLSIPPFGCATPDVYRTWDRLGGPAGDGSNDLEPAALEVEPGLVAWRDDLGDATGQTPIMAGSGSTWFVPGSFPGSGRIVVHTLGPFVD